MIEIDGSSGEGGGQILRTSLALSLITGKSFRISRIRANRQKPGLQRQHLMAVEAAAKISNSSVEGGHLNSSELTFTPGPVTPGDYHFNIGSAGSSPLVFQTLLPALLVSSQSSSVVIEGGTHNAMAPPYDFLQKTFLPVLKLMGANVSSAIHSHGFYPIGGGKIAFEVTPVTQWRPLNLLDRGKIRAIRARSLISRLSENIAERELAVVAAHLEGAEPAIEHVPSPGTGNVVLIEVEAEQLTEVISSIGERGLPAERVALKAVEQAKAYLATDAPVGLHLADQLLLPVALAGKGAFKTGSLSLHFTTNMATIEKFLPVKFTITPEHCTNVIRL